MGGGSSVRASARASGRAVWSAITEPDGLSAWFPFDIEGERTTGAPLRFVFREERGRRLRGRDGRVRPAVGHGTPLGGRRDPAAGGHADGSGCVLTLINRFDEIGKAARDAAGWHACLDLARGPPRRRRADRLHERWKSVHPVYVERFGPEAATIGPPTLTGSDPFRFRAAHCRGRTPQGSDP